MDYWIIGIACGLALVSLGGGLYEFSVVDHAWPRNPLLIQPSKGGISRKRFWIPAHIAFEIALLVSIVVSWAEYPVRALLLVALTSHTVMRIWSAVDFIPKALAFERADASNSNESAARTWTRRSVLRFPLDLLTCAAMLSAFAAAARFA